MLPLHPVQQLYISQLKRCGTCWKRTGDKSDYGGLSDSDDEYLPDTGTQAMADITVHNINESSEDEAEEGANCHCGIGSVDRGHLRKCLLDCSLPVFWESPTMTSIVETPLS